MDSNPLHSALRRLAFGGTLSSAESSDAFGVVMRGEATAAQVSALLMGLRVKGETSEEVAGAATALREAMVRLPAQRPAELLDTCGTGGGAVPTFNISTATALLAAGMGVRVAKHGNRSFTSQCGSADVLEALGVPLDVPTAVMARALEDAGIVFMFAPSMHPAMRHVGPVRRELGLPTVMNVVGPLANPAGAGKQVLGVAEANRLGLLAGALASLGTGHALVVHGEPGMDEVSPLGPTKVLEVRDGEVASWRIEPSAFGYRDLSASDLAGGSPGDNARIIVEVLQGRGNPAATAAVVLNAAAALYVAGVTANYAAGVRTAREAVAAGAGIAALDRMRAAYAAGGN